MSVLSLSEGLKPQELKRSTFDLSHFNATTGHLGELIPVYVEEVVPGDTFNIRTNHLLRLLPLAGPPTQRVDLFIHYFFVPNRILFDLGEWQEWITGRTSSNLLDIDLYGTGIAADSIGIYMGLPQGSWFSEHKTVNCIPLRAYIQIYNDYYRRKNNQEKITWGDLNYGSKLITRNWRKDYFTSGMYTPQYGAPSAVTIDITYLSQSLVQTTGGLPSEDGDIQSAEGMLKDASGYAANIKNINTAQFEINDFRWAYAYQDFLQRMLQAGDDYGDHLLLLFGVKTSDHRLQRAEYLGGYSSPVIVNEVTQMSPFLNSESEEIPLGTQGGTGYSFGSGENIECFVEEHGYIMGIMSVIPKSIHYGGISKHLLKSTQLDFYFPQFAHLPEQTIQNQEVFYEHNDQDGSNEEAFAYIERYAEYKHRNDKITGEMVADFDYMHWAQMYDSLPTLGDTFLKCTPREDVFAVQGSIHFFGQVGFEVTANRPMPFNVDALTLDL